MTPLAAALLAAAAVDVARGDVAVALEVVDRAALDDDDLVARAVLTFTF